MGDFTHFSGNIIGIFTHFQGLLMDDAADYEGHHAKSYGGHPAPTGPALPNLINAVKMLKSTSKPH
jgi:hypothetical protein